MRCRQNFVSFSCRGYSIMHSVYPARGHSLPHTFGAEIVPTVAVSTNRASSVWEQTKNGVGERECPGRERCPKGNRVRYVHENSLYIYPLPSSSRSGTIAAELASSPRSRAPTEGMLRTHSFDSVSLYWQKARSSHRRSTQTRFEQGSTSD